MADLSLSFSDLYSQVSQQLSYGTTPTGAELTVVKNIVVRAYRQFLFPINPKTGSIHIWSFLKKSWTFATTNLNWKYALPDDFREIIGNLYFSTMDGYTEVKKVSRDNILQRRVNANTHTVPEVFAVVASDFDVSAGSTWELWLDPVPSGIWNLNLTYIFNPPKPYDTTDKLIGGPLAQEALLELCLAIAEQQEDDLTTRHHTDLAKQLMGQLLLEDLGVDAADYGAIIIDGSTRFWDMEYPNKRIARQARLTAYGQSI